MLTRNNPLRVGAVKSDGSPDDNDRTEIGPTALAFSEWAKLGLVAPNLRNMRKARLQRIVAQLQLRDYAGVLLFNPINIRYATDSSNMHIWVANNPARAVFVAASGYVILWDFVRCEHLSKHLTEIDEIREGAGFFYFLSGDKEDELAGKFAAQVDDVVRRHGGGNRRLAIDRIQPSALQPLTKLGVEVESGMQLMEHARVVKSVDEIRAMRCAIASGEAAVAAMRAQLRPGITEVELWSVLHAENIKRGGEWIETRLLASGPRTNPWMQEAGPRILQEGDLLGFDTDMIGPYGMCVDFSRTWFVGELQPSAEQRELFQIAHEHVTSNAELLQPGVGFRELTERGHRLPEKYRAQRYAIMFHGVGLCDEYPAIYYPEDYIEDAFDNVLQPGMVLCAEAYVGAAGARDGVKLEDQILITENGWEILTRYPFDEKLLD